MNITENTMDQIYRTASLEDLLKQHKSMRVEASMLCDMAELLIALDRNNSMNFAVEKCAKLANVNSRTVINAAVDMLVKKWTKTDRRPCPVCEDSACEINSVECGK